MRYSKTTSVLLACLMGLAGCAGATEEVATPNKGVQPSSSAEVLAATDAMKPIEVATAGQPDGKSGLVIASKGQSQAVVAVSAGAGKEEKAGADDLVKYIQMMTGAKVALANTPEAIANARAGKLPVILVGQAAVEAKPDLKGRLEKAAKPNPEIRSDAIVLVREGNTVYVAGNNDESHYFAVSQLLHLWGVRWFMPTEIGECVPDVKTLEVGKLDMAYGSPFESRMYWIAWAGDPTGYKEFSRRNFMSSLYVTSGHVFGKYVKEIIPPGKTHYDVPITDPNTAKVVASKVIDQFGKGQNVMMGMEDGWYKSEYKPDIETNANLYDKYFQITAQSDSFMIFYNQLSRILLAAHPESKSKIGFLIYSNITMPAQRGIVAEKPLIGYLAAIDVDPTHGMDDVRSASRQEYRDMMYQWSKTMQGRVIIYDYDQGMLVWRDIPNPSHMAFKQDVKHYQKAGIMGIGTESRNATATVFTNLYIRGQLMWNPDADVDQMLAEFYPKFYGPAAGPMSRFWGSIYKAWDETIALEHEFFVAPVVYTPELVAGLGKDLAEAEALVLPLKGKANLSRNEKQYVERMQMARLQYGVIENYMKMVWSASRDCDYKAAVASGKEGLKVRDEMTALNGTFTTYKKIGERGWAWFPGEVKQYEVYDKLTDGTTGRLVQKLPLEWNFRRDPNDTGYPRGWKDARPDLTYWNKNKSQYPGIKRKDYPTTEWEVLRTDLYAQAQGVLHPDYQSFTGYMWYQTDVELSAADAKKPVHVMFPGLFSEAWLYVNGALVAHRPQGQIWWLNDYRFEWDVDLAGKLKAGKNNVVIRVKNTHHNGGMFRRAFLYEPVAVAGGAGGSAGAEVKPAGK